MNRFIVQISWQAKVAGLNAGYFFAINRKLFMASPNVSKGQEQRTALDF